MRPIGTACYFNGHIKTDVAIGAPYFRIDHVGYPLAEDRRPVLALFRARVRLSDALHGDACCDLFLHLEFGRWHVD